MNGSDLADGVREGEILDGKYRIERFLGTGGMGIVYAARHLALDERVAIKFLHAGNRDDSDAEARFLREARAAVKIKSEHVARVTDVGQTPNGGPYMVMEYLAGEDLAEMLLKRCTLAVEQAVDFVLQACEAIAEAHGLGIIHRDLKPANLFCIRRPDGALSIKVLDFGISKLDGPNVTAPELDTGKSANVIGSPYYMSPEQLRASKGVDVRTDIWSIGISLYELFTGHKPFSGDTMPELCLAIVSQAPSSVRDHRPDIPPELAQILDKCLQKDRDARYKNIAELAVALAPFGSQHARSSVDRILGILQSSRLPSSAAALPPISSRRGDTTKLPATSAAWGHTTPTPHRTQILLVAALASALLGFFLLPVVRGNGASVPQPTPAVSIDAARGIARITLPTHNPQQTENNNQRNTPTPVTAPQSFKTTTVVSTSSELPPKPNLERQPTKLPSRNRIGPSSPSAPNPPDPQLLRPRRGIYEEME